MEFRQTPVFHTFFLPKRERKYQRKRFRAAARTPRGHRSCSALSALEMRRRLQRCNCSSQNEALAPLMGRKAFVFGCSHNVPPKTPEGKRGFSRIILPSLNEGTISNAEVAWALRQRSPHFRGSPRCHRIASESTKKAPAIADTLYSVGIYLSSRHVAMQVLSARQSLTSVFGMGTGGPSA